MISVAHVKLWGTKIGTVALMDGESTASFEYDPQFALSGIEVSPLMMPLSSQVYSFPSLARESFRGLPGLLADSLPDKFGNAVIDRWLERQGRTPNSFNAVERLCYTGSRGMGALEFEPALNPDASKSERVEISALVELARDVLSQRQDACAPLKGTPMDQILQVGTSAGGARAKAIVAWNELTDDIRSGQVDAGPGYGYWIIKLDGIKENGDKEGSDKQGYSRVEYAYYLMARAAGVGMSESRLYEENGRAHFMTRRFDRVGEPTQKLHMQTLGAIAHFDLNDAGSCSYEQTVRVMRRLGLGQDEVEQFFRRMVFNIMARNQDDHVKNTSFLMNKSGIWRLAPAYDVTYAFNPTGLWTSRHQMSANGKLDGFTHGDLMEAGKHMSISRARAKSAIDDIADAVTQWNAFAESAGVPEARASAIGKTHVMLIG